MERKLASIQRIVALEPIEGADLIEAAQILGWRVVVKKGEYQVSDLVVYCEIDSFIPHSVAPFLTKPDHFPKEYQGITGERLRTVKLRGQVSQGLILPLNVLDDVFFTAYNDNVEEGTEVTDYLGIVKYDPPMSAQLAGVARGNFPSFLHKTDEERVQNLGHLLGMYEGTQMYITEKLDGSSMTVYYRDGEFGVCSRNLDLRESEGNAFWQTAREFDLETKMAALGANFALQGELVGPGIQKNPLGLDKLTFFVYNVFSIDTCKHLDFVHFQTIVNQVLGLQTVPILSTDHSLVASTDHYVDAANGMKSALNPKVLAEGMVVRPLEEITTRYGRVSFKAINNKYLLKIGE